MIELVDRLERHDERRPSMVLENHGGRERRFEAMRVVMLDDASKGALRRAGGRRLGVVWKGVQEPLHLGRRSHAPKDSPFFRREGRQGWSDGADRSRAGRVAQCACLKACIRSGGVQSLPLNMVNSVPSEAITAVRRLCVTAAALGPSRMTDTPRADAK